MKVMPGCDKNSIYFFVIKNILIKEGIDKAIFITMVLELSPFIDTKFFKVKFLFFNNGNNTLDA